MASGCSSAAAARRRDARHAQPAPDRRRRAPLLQSLTSWDGWWYLGIVRDGYHAAPPRRPYHDYAFLPLFPMLVRLLALPSPGWEG